LTGQVVDSTYPALLQGLNNVLQERRDRFRQIPPSERARFLIEQERRLFETLKRREGQEFHFAPLDDELLDKADVEVVETPSGIPGVKMNLAYREELLGIQSKAHASALPWMMAVDEDSIPFVVFGNSGTDDITRSDLAIHETSHIAWRTLRQFMLGIPQPQTKIQDAFMRIQDEGISISAAGENQFSHSGMSKLLNKYGMSPEDYDKCESLYQRIIHKIDPQDLTLGIMNAQNMQGLIKFLEGVSTTVESLQDIERPEFDDFI